MQADIGADTPLEVWFQDEGRIGQMTHLTRRWAPKGSRPRQVKDQRFKAAYMFGAICPERGVGAAIVSPFCNTDAMNKHLAELSTQVAPSAHAIVVMDQAAWHTTAKLDLPDNLSLVFLPPKCPELNCMENVWQFLKNLYLGNRVFDDYEHIISACCDAWNSLIATPERIRTIGQREWAAKTQRSI